MLFTYPRQLDENLARLTADNPEAVSIGQGVGIGLSMVGTVAASELAAARLVAGLRWAGATRTALVVSRITWAGAEGELLGARAAWQGYNAAPWQESAKQVLMRGAFDYTAQTSANFLTGDSDPFRNVNVLETGMSSFGFRASIIGFSSAAFNFNSRGYLKTVFSSDHDHRVYPGSFFAQAFIGTTIGRGGLALEEHLLTRGSKSAAVGL